MKLHKLLLWIRKLSVTVQVHCKTSKSHFLCELLQMLLCSSSVLHSGWRNDNLNIWIIWKSFLLTLLPIQWKNWADMLAAARHNTSKHDQLQDCVHLSSGLTVKSPVLGIQRGLNGTSRFPHQAFKLSAAQVRQCLLHGTGAAGVSLRADAEMLACR